MTLYLDTETTGLSIGDRLIEVGVVNDEGDVIFESLINPQISIPTDATAIHGITDAMVADAPIFASIGDLLRNVLLADGTIVIYNADFDMRFFPEGFWEGIRVHCALERYAIAVGRRRKLERAARAAGYRPTTLGHRAVADAQACRAVWRWLNKQGIAAPDRFANVDPQDLARRAWDAQLRAREATAELNQIKSALIARSNGEKQMFIIPGVCRVSISASIDTTGRATYRVDRDALASLDPNTRRMLFDLGVIRISDKIGSRYQMIRFTDISGSDEVDWEEAS